MQRQLHSFATRAGLGGHTPVRDRLNEVAYAHTHDFVVIGHQNPNFPCARGELGGIRGAHHGEIRIQCHIASSLYMVRRLASASEATRGETRSVASDTLSAQSR